MSRTQGAAQPSCSDAVTVLLVDDEQDVRTLLRFLIGRTGAPLQVVAEATDGRSALEQWRSQRPDVIVLDEQMANLSGMEVARQILAEDPAQTIVLYSAYLTPDLEDEASELGVRLSVAKGDFNQLLDYLTDLARGRA